MCIRDSYILSMRKMFSYRLFPNKKQLHMLNETLEECRWLYNHLLAERKDVYEHTGKGPSLYEQQAAFGLLKAGRPSLTGVHSQVLQNVAVRVDPVSYTHLRAHET